MTEITPCLGEPDCTPSATPSGWTHHRLCPSAYPRRGADGAGYCCEDCVELEGAEPPVSWTAGTLHCSLGGAAVTFHPPHVWTYTREDDSKAYFNCPGQGEPANTGCAACGSVSPEQTPTPAADSAHRGEQCTVEGSS